MEKYKELEMMLCDEIDRITDQKNLTSSSLDTLDKLAHTLKSIQTIGAMDDYSEDGGYSMDSMSYARGRGRNARRDSMGRYASEGRYDERYDGRYNEGRYSGRY